MNIEQERADFEAWHQRHHGDRDVYALDESGEYVDKQVQVAFNVWQARAALQSQDREDAERYRALRDAMIGPEGSDKHFEHVFDGMGYDEPSEIPPEVFDAGIDDAINHARRIEGEGE